MLRAGDLMQTELPDASARTTPIREAGLAMARADYDLVPVVDDDGALSESSTDRALARRYIRESRRDLELREATYVQAVVDVLEGSC